jgi:hypothetical protein
MATTQSQKTKPNGAASPAAAADLDDIDAAAALPNVDGRQSIVEELPADLDSPSVRRKPPRTRFSGASRVRRIPSIATQTATARNMSRR